MLQKSKRYNTRGSGKSGREYCSEVKLVYLIFFLEKGRSRLSFRDYATVLKKSHFFVPIGDRFISFRNTPEIPDYDSFLFFSEC